MGRGIVSVVKVERVHQSATKHQSPKSICPILVEGGIVTIGSVFSEPFSTAEVRDWAYTICWRSGIQLIGRDNWLNQTGPIRKLRARSSFIAREDGGEFNFPIRLVCDKCLLVFVGKE